MFTQQKQSNGFEWGEFISGILFIVAGFFMMTHQGVALKSLVLVFSLISIVQGLVWISSYFGLRGVFHFSWIALLSGVIDLGIGLLFLFKDNVGAITIAMLFAIWFLTDSIIGIIFAWNLRSVSTAWFVVTLIMNIFSLVIAVMMLMNPVVSALTLILLVSFYFILYGINNILQSIAHHN